VLAEGRLISRQPTSWRRAPRTRLVSINARSSPPILSSLPQLPSPLLATSELTALIRRRGQSVQHKPSWKFLTRHRVRWTIFYVELLLSGLEAVDVSFTAEWFNGRPNTRESYHNKRTPLVETLPSFEYEEAQLWRVC
jgi:hypothetical protein